MSFANESIAPYVLCMHMDVVASKANYDANNHGRLLVRAGIFEINVGRWASVMS